MFHLCAAVSLQCTMLHGSHIRNFCHSEYILCNTLLHRPLHMGEVATAVGQLIWQLQLWHRALQLHQEPTGRRSQRWRAGARQLLERDGKHKVEISDIKVNYAEEVQGRVVWNKKTKGFQRKVHKRQLQHKACTKI